MSENKYKLLKNFTPKDLYEAFIELFLKYKEGRLVDINFPWYLADENLVRGSKEMSAVLMEAFQPWIPWLIENKFIEEIEEEIELKPGMILESTEGNFKCQYIVTNNGLYYSKGFSEKAIGNPSKDYKDCKTLQELNNISGCGWRILY